MEGKANLPASSVPEPSKTNLNRPINSDSNLSRSFTSSSSSSSSSFSSSPPDFIRHVQAAFKRHRSLGTMQSNNMKPRRVLLPQRAALKSSASEVGVAAGSRKTQEDSFVKTNKTPRSAGETKEGASITPLSFSGTVTNADVENSKVFDLKRDESGIVTTCGNNSTVSSVGVESEHVQLVDGKKKVHFAADNYARTQGANNPKATGRDGILSHMHSLALTDTEWDMSNQEEVSAGTTQDLKHHNIQSMEVGFNLRSEGGPSLLTKRGTGVHDVHPFGTFLQSDSGHPMTQSSVVGSSCTTTLVNLASASDIGSTTDCSHPHQSRVSQARIKFLGDQNVSHRDTIQPSCDSKIISGLLANQNVTAVPSPNLAVDIQLEVRDYDQCKEQNSMVSKESEIQNHLPPPGDKLSKWKCDVTDVKSQAPLPKTVSSDAKIEASKSEKHEKVPSGKAPAAPRKRNHDTDLFFRVKGKLYQRLGKIGSGGSSEVHKVISSDCTIYALKKIKLKGRDYATAYGFCQEIAYLNRLKGKNNIIQLIDYEVTDKNLLREVMNGSMSSKDGRVKEDGCIYMVLEYGEIDLANMLSQKWKELDSSNSTIDENWLRFYWQQILLAVNTIHEERIVHSDLKPANFLLVRGSLKLIDFGIAKAIMSDTTNIQRDSQVGTLSYMSPEAFMCNEKDANGNTIKCGRLSDIWSLGCILYQMVYGRTPFSDYKTFWTKFKVITDPNHEIVYEPLSNPWLLDLLKKCLAWDRNERWRIPQLLQHAFLVPPIQPQLFFPRDQSCKLFQLIAETCRDDQKALVLCSRLQQVLGDSRLTSISQASISKAQLCKFLCDMSNICSQLQEQITKFDDSGP